MLSFLARVVRAAVTRYIRFVRRVIVFYSGFYLPEGAFLYSDFVVRLTFSVYYLPILAVLFAVGGEVGLSIVFSLLVPVLQAEDSTVVPDNWIVSNTMQLLVTMSRATVGLSSNTVVFLLRVVPYGVLIFAFAVVFQKTMTCVVEAMVDAFSTFDKKDYALSCMRLQFMLETRQRMATLAIVGVLGSLGVHVAFGTNLLLVWSSRETRVQIATWVIIAAQVMYVAVTVIWEWLHVPRSRPAATKPAASAAAVATPAMTTAAMSTPLLGRPSSRGSKGNAQGTTATAGLRRNSSSVVASKEDLSTPFRADSHRMDSVSFSDASIAAATAIGTPCPLQTHEATSLADTTTASAQPRKLYSTRPFIERWWRRHIHRIRFFAIEMLLVFVAYWVVTAGVLDAVSFAAETLVYLNIPNVLCFCAVSIAIGTARGIRAVKWLYRHPAFALPVWLVAAPYAATLAYCTAYFGFRPAPSAVFFVCLVWHLLRCIDLAQSYVVGPDGWVRWTFARTHTSLPAPLASLFEDALERGTRPTIVSLDIGVDLPNMTLYQRGHPPQQIVREVLRRAPPSPSHSTTSPKTSSPQSASTSGVSWQPQNNAVIEVALAGRSVVAVVRKMLPRVIILQSRFSFSAGRFNTARIILRLWNTLFLVCFFALLTAAVVQHQIPALRPVPVTATVNADFSTLEINHLVVKLLASAGTATPPSFDGEPPPPLADEDQFTGLCTRSFNGISVWEMAWLSVIPYLSDTAHIQNVLEFMKRRMGSDWESREVDDPIGTAFHWRGFMELRSAKRNTTVVAVRGTDLTSAVDMLQDVSCMFDIVLYHIITALVPGSSLLPSTLVADQILFISTIEAWVTFERLGRRGQRGGAVVERHYWKTVLRHVERLLNEQQEGRTRCEAGRTKESGNREALLLTGHSLGGAITHAVGARTGCPSVAFSSPGIMLARRKYGLWNSHIHATSFTVAPAHDIVPFIGWQGGELHHITCDAPTRELCHAVEHTIKSLWRGCPSIREQFPGVGAIW